MNGLMSNRELEMDHESNRNIDMNELKSLLTERWAMIYEEYGLQTCNDYHAFWYDLKILMAN